MDPWLRLTIRRVGVEYRRALGRRPSDRRLKIIYICSTVSDVCSVLCHHPAFASVVAAVVVTVPPLPGLASRAGGNDRRGTEFSKVYGRKAGLRVDNASRTIFQDKKRGMDGAGCG